MSKKSLGVGCIYAGSILGAGFATGRELLTYFVSYGIKGFIGIGICCLLFAFLGYKTLFICIKENLYDYSAFTDPVMGKILGSFMKILSFLFLNVMFSAMLSGFGELTGNIFAAKPLYGSIILAVICFFMLMGGSKYLSAVSTILCPFLIFGCVILGIYIFYDSTFTLSQAINLRDNFLFSAIIYTSYNIITAVSLLANVSKSINSKKEAVFSGFICGLALLLAGTALALPMYLGKISQSTTLPLLTLIQDKIILKQIYALILALAVITTALSNGYCISEFLHKHLKLKRNFACFLACILGLMLSEIGFSVIVNNVYYIFGVAGLGEIAAILMYKIKS